MNKRLQTPARPEATTSRAPVLQPKLAAGASNDRLEQEADRIADQVLATPTHPGHGQMDAARENADAGPSGPGRPLEPVLRQDMEQRFGHDFSRVRVHSGAAAADALGARAYTVGQDIVFGGSEYRPENPAGRHLIAHELAHVVQQRTGAPQAAGIGLQMQPDPRKKKAPPAVKQPTTQAGWTAAVDSAVRTMFGLGKKDLSSSRTSFVSTAEFAKRFPASQLEEHLMNIFLDQGEDIRGTIGQILDYNNHPYALAGPTSTTISMLRDFIKEGIKKDKFEGQTREIEVATGKRFPVFTFTPRELAAEFIAGVTDIAPDIPKRTITIQEGATVPVLVHETCHFYVHNRYRDMALARTDSSEYLYLRGARIGQILLEGFAEYFARKVMKANGAVFGPTSGKSYQAEVEVVEEIVGVIGGLDVAKNAYFHGDKKAVALVGDAIDTLKTRAPIKVISVPPVIVR
jgi:hypothetical protein